jgi:hypothetical protein
MEAQKRKFTVTKTISAQQSYRKLSEYSEGDTVVGKYVGTHVCQYDKQNPKIQVLEAIFKDGTGPALAGKILVVNHCGALGKAMEEVEVGEYVQLEYTGTVPLTKGKFAGKDCYTFDVQVVTLDEGDASDSL